MVGTEIFDLDIAMLITELIGWNAERKFC
jgi:hypothetical protein